MARPFYGASEELKCKALRRVMADCGSRVTTYFASASATGRRDRTSQGLTHVCGPGTVDVIIPANVRELSDECFKGCSSSLRVTFGPLSSLERIGVDCFTGTSVEEVSVPDRVRELCDGCFKGCSNLRRVTFGPSSSLERIGVGCFTGTSVEEFSVPDRVRELCDGCFKGCSSLRRVTFGPLSSLERIGVKAFGPRRAFVVYVIKCGLVEISIPDSVRELCDGCFKGCSSLRRVTFGPSSCLERIGDLCFDGVGLVGLKIPASVKHLGRNWFRSAPFTEYSDEEALY